MNTNRRLALAAVSASVAMASIPTTATAENVSTSFSVTAASSGLAITSIPTTASAGSVSYNPSAVQGTTGSVGSIGVTDARGTLVTGWTLGVSGSSWADGGTTGAPAGKGVVFFPVVDVTTLGNVANSTLTGMNLVTCHCAADGSTALLTRNLGSSYNVATGIATSLLSTPTATFTPSVYVEVPANTPVGTYTSTVTFVLS